MNNVERRTGPIRSDTWLRANRSNYRTFHPPLEQRCESSEPVVRHARLRMSVAAGQVASIIVEDPLTKYSNFHTPASSRRSAIAWSTRQRSCADYYVACLLPLSARKMVSCYAAQRLASSRNDASIGRPMRATARLELWLFFLVVMYAACSGVVKNFAN